MTHIAGPGGPFDRNAVVVDATDAVLLDNINSCVIAQNGDENRPAVALDLGGRVNKTTRRSSVLYLMDEEGAAKLAADLIGLAHRNGTGDRFMAALSAHLGTQV